MREWWANVYAAGLWDGPEDVAYVMPNRLSTRELADARCAVGRIGRVHVRLKPEGAPRRYASEANRRAWEERPRQAKALAEVGMQACLEDDGLIYDPRYL